MATVPSLLAQIAASDELEVVTAEIAKLKGTVGVGELPFPAEDELKLEGTGTLVVFDQLLEVGGSLKAEGGFLGLDHRVDPFGVGEKLPLRVGFNTGRFALSAHLDAKAEGGLGGSGLAISAKAGLSAGFLYEHYRAEPKSRKAATAFGNLILESRMPMFLDLSEPPELGEVHRFEGKLGLDFGLDLKAGYKWADETALGVAGELDLPLKLGVEASLRAALGLGLYERMHLAVGRSAQLEDRWIRVRFQRERERRLTFGLTFALNLEYDLGTGLVQIFEEAIDQVPTERLVQAAKRIAEFSDPERLKEILSGEVTEVIEDLVQEGIVDTVDDLIPFAQQVVDAYEGLDERIQGLWERALAGADLGSGSNASKWLESLAGLDPSSFSVDAFLADQEIGKLLPAIESLSGRSAEELLLSDETLREALEDVSGVASRTLHFLRDTPADLVAKMQTFAGRTGIARTVEILSTVDTLEELEQQVSTRIRKLSERIVGKALDRFELEDLERINEWAEKMASWLDPEDAAFGGGIAAMVRENLEKIHLKYGLSIGFEIDRVSRHNALLDLELDHREKNRSLRRRVSLALRDGNPADILEELAAASGMVEKTQSATHEVARESGFVLRECVFTSERIRSSATTIVFNLAGLGRLFGSNERGFTRRIEQASLRITDRPVGGPEVEEGERFLREGHYAAGYQRGFRTNSLETESAAWHILDDSGFGLDRKASYDGPEQSSFLDLRFCWEDHTPSDRELDALFRLLEEIGFAPLSPGPSSTQELEALLAGAPSSRLGFQVRFDGGVLDSVGKALASADGAEVFRRAYLNACYRSYAETFVSRGRLPGSPGRDKNAGEALSRILADSPEVRQVLTGTNVFHNVPDFNTVKVHFPDAGQVSYAIGTSSHPEPITPYFFGIQKTHKAGKKALVDGGDDSLFALREKIAASRMPEDYERVLAAFVHAAYRSSLESLLWPNCMFSTWFWIALVSIADPGALEQAVGVATLRWRDKSQGGSEDPPWSEPMFWRLREGVRDQLGNAGVFPIS